MIDPVLIYSTFIGGTSSECGNGIAVDPAGNAYVVGTTFSANYPATPGAFSTVPDRIVITKLNRNGSGLVYSTFFGGGNLVEEALAIAVDAAGQAYIIGDTTLRDLPTTAYACDRTRGTNGMRNQDFLA